MFARLAFIVLCGVAQPATPEDLACKGLHLDHVHPRSGPVHPAQLVTFFHGTCLQAVLRQGGLMAVLSFLNLSKARPVD